MTAPTSKQVSFFNDLFSNTAVMGALTKDETIIVNRANKPGATMAQMSMALNILRTKRDSLKGASTVEGAKTEGTPTPPCTWPERRERFVTLLAEFREANDIALEVTSVVEQASPPDSCLNCGHEHAGKMMCVAPSGESEVDPRYSSLPPQSQSTWQHLSGGQTPTTVPTSCGCTTYAEPDLAEVMAWEAQQVARKLAAKVNNAWKAAREFKAGDPMVITGKTKQQYPTGTRGTYIRMWQGAKGVAVVFRTTDLVMDASKTSYVLKTGSPEMDVWVREGALTREDDVPETLPQDVMDALSNSKA